MRDETRVELFDGIEALYEENKSDPAFFRILSLNGPTYRQILCLGVILFCASRPKVIDQSSHRHS